MKKAISSVFIAWMIMITVGSVAAQESYCDWTGTWDTNWEEMKLVQTGNQVTGNYEYDDGKIVGVVSGYTLTGTWSEAPSYDPFYNDAGDVELTISADCNSFTGRWRYGSTGDWSSIGAWTGTRVAPSPTPTPTATVAQEPPCDWTGTWDTNWEEMKLVQTGNQVTGTYVYDDGKIVGVVSGYTLTGTWSEAPSYDPFYNDAGDVELTISADCNSFTGRWRYGSTGDWSSIGAWTGTRVAPSPKPTLTHTLAPIPTPTSIPAPIIAPATPAPTLISQPTGKPQITISQTSLLEEPGIGDEAMITVSLKNIGDSIARNVQLTERIPSSVSVSYVDGADNAGGLVSWSGDLSPGQSRSIQHTFRILEARDRFFIAKVTYEDAEGNKRETSTNVYITTEVADEASSDSDGDGWSDEREKSAGTNPYSKDTDNDGLWDSQDPNPLMAQKPGLPGFEAIFAVAGLLAVAYLVRKKGGRIK